MYVAPVPMLIRADARALPLADASVDCVVTSPPYWGLRDYGHAGQIGLEPTPEAYLATLVGIGRELWRVLQPQGTAWLNIGDCYANDGKWGGETGGKQSYLPDNDRKRVGREKRVTGLKPKDLVGIPWRVAFALQADGWYLRADIIWAKPNPMPESVIDRPTKAHEYVFLLAKSERYYYDAAAIRESVTGNSHTRGNGMNPKCVAAGQGIKQNTSFSAAVNKLVAERNARSVWTITTEPYPDAHFATFPPALAERCILAGCPLGGTVLDPFIGSGTVGAVAERLGRRWVGVDLAYQDLAQARTVQRGLRFDEVSA